MPTYYIGTAFWAGAGAQSLTPSSGADDTSSWTRTLSMGVRPVQESAAGGRSYEQAPEAVTPEVWSSQDSVGTLLPGLVGGFELLGADAAEVAVPA